MYLLRFFSNPEVLHPEKGIEFDDVLSSSRDFCMLPCEHVAEGSCEYFQETAETARRAWVLGDFAHPEPWSLLEQLVGCRATFCTSSRGEIKSSVPFRDMSG